LGNFALYIEFFSGFPTINTSEATTLLADWRMANDGRYLKRHIYYYFILTYYNSSKKQPPNNKTKNVQVV